MIPTDVFKDKLIFFGLSDEQIKGIAEVAEQQVYNGGELICREGERGDSMFIVLSGKVDVLKKNREGREVKLATLSPGAIFGEMTLVNVEPRSATVSAVEEAVVVILKNSALSDIFMQDRELLIVILINIARILSKRLREANEKLM